MSIYLLFLLIYRRLTFIDSKLKFLIEFFHDLGQAFCKFSTNWTLQHPDTDEKIDLLQGVYVQKYIKFTCLQKINFKNE